QFLAQVSSIFVNRKKLHVARQQQQSHVIAKARSSFSVSRQAAFRRASVVGYRLAPSVPSQLAGMPQEKNQTRTKIFMSNHFEK
ncbi:unnamed protein product, partial [Amoebophrya sp. A120]